MRWKLRLWKGRTGRKTSRKPLNTAFRQQRLKAWQPNLSPQGIIPMLVVITLVFAPIGVGLLVSVLRTQTLVINYEQCHLQANTNGFETIPREYVESNFHKSPQMDPQWRLIRNDANNLNNITCQLLFEIPNNIKSPLYVYYHLTNYYQNHRKYIESFDINQLKGAALFPHQLDTNCHPFKEIDGKSIYPCGVIANTLFNDTFTHKLTNINDDKLSVPLTNEGIAWHTDKHRYKPTKYNASQIVPPPNWYHMFPNGYTDDNIPNLQTWQELQVWMRGSALPKFYKLALHNTSTHLEVQSGTYTTDIGLNYPVLSFNGTKAFVLTTSHITGARNITLSIVYFIIAGLSALFAIVFLIFVLIKPKQSISRSQSHLQYIETGHRRRGETEDRFNDNNSAFTGNIPVREII